MLHRLGCTFLACLCLTLFYNLLPESPPFIFIPSLSPLACSVPFILLHFSVPFSHIFAFNFSHQHLTKPFPKKCQKMNLSLATFPLSVKVLASVPGFFCLGNKLSGVGIIYWFIRMQYLKQGSSCWGMGVNFFPSPFPRQEVIEWGTLCEASENAF